MKTEGNPYWIKIDCVVVFRVYSWSSFEANSIFVQALGSRPAVIPIIQMGCHPERKELPN